MKYKKLHNPEQEFSSGHFSSAIVAGGLIFVSGQGPLDMKTGQVREGSIGQQTQWTLESIERILKEAGADRSNIVRCSCYVSKLSDFKEFNAAYKQFFSRQLLPARTTVQCGLLRGIGVEIDAIAVAE